MQRRTVLGMIAAAITAPLTRLLDREPITETQTVTVELPPAGCSVRWSTGFSRGFCSSGNVDFGATAERTFITNHGTEPADVWLDGVWQTLAPGATLEVPPTDGLRGVPLIDWPERHLIDLKAEPIEVTVSMGDHGVDDLGNAFSLDVEAMLDENERQAMDSLSRLYRKRR